VAAGVAVVEAVASFSFVPSPMNRSNSLSKSSAVFGFFGALLGRAPPRLERIGPVPLLWDVISGSSHSRSQSTYGDATVVDESSWLRRSANAGFCILLRSELGALATRRAVRGGPESYAMDIGWPANRESQHGLKKPYVQRWCGMLVTLG
jgi:hypothetical protein